LIKLSSWVIVKSRKLPRKAIVTSRKSPAWEIKKIIHAKGCKRQTRPF
jgi:hypothetical protein